MFGFGDVCDGEVEECAYVFGFGMLVCVDFVGGGVEGCVWSEVRYCIFLCLGYVLVFGLVSFVL